MQHPLVSKFEALARRIGSLFDRGGAESAESYSIEVPKSPSWLPDWRQILESESQLWRSSRERRERRVLVGTVAGGHPACAAVESTIAASLTLRGADVEVLLCDGALPACLQCSADQFPDLDAFVKTGPKSDLCAPCYEGGLTAYNPLGLKIRRLSEFLTPEDYSDAAKIAQSLDSETIKQFRYDDIDVGEHAYAGTLRYFASGDLEQEGELGWSVARKFIETGILARMASRRLFQDNRYDCVFMNHGIYVPHGIIRVSAQKVGIRAAIWELAARSSCIHVAHEDAVFSLINEPTSVWEDMRWSDAAENELMAYVQSRWSGSLDWIYKEMHAGSQTHKEEFEREFGIDFSKPTFGLLTNVIWDAALFYPAKAFNGLVEWMVETINYFAEKPDFNLVIRVHPAEVRGNMTTRQTAKGELSKVFPEFPKNVYFVPPESRANTYALMSLCDAAIIYGTTTGMELTSVGIPVITAGQAFIKNKGITLDANSKEEYFAILDRLPLGQRMTKAQITRARKYAYNYYFRQCVPLACTEAVKDWPPLKINLSSLSQLMPGEDLGIDVVCNGILDGAEFTFPAEEVAFDRQNVQDNSYKQVFETTPVVTKNSSMRAGNSLQLTLHSIFNTPQCNGLVEELSNHLRRIEMDDSYSAVFDGCSSFFQEQMCGAQGTRKELLAAGLCRLHVHAAQTTFSENAYVPGLKPNPNAVYYPNPVYGRSLNEEYPFVRNIELIKRGTKVAVGGDDVASKIGDHLKNKNFDVRSLGTFSDAKALRDIVEFGLGVKALPRVVFGAGEGTRVVHPLFPAESFDSLDDCKKHFDEYQASLRATLERSDVALISLKTSDGLTLRIEETALPTKSVKLPPYATSCHSMTSREVTQELKRALDCWRTVNPNVIFIVSVSPVPVDGVLDSNGEHIVQFSAKCKAKLRVALEDFVHANSDATFYFPAFDATMYATAQPLQDDMEHLSDESIQKLSNLFEMMFVQS